MTYTVTKIWAVIRIWDDGKSGHNPHQSFIGMFDTEDKAVKAAFAEHGKYVTAAVKDGRLISKATDKIDGEEGKISITFKMETDQRTVRRCRINVIPYEMKEEP